MIFDLDGAQPVWFELDDGGRVQLRALTDEDWRAIRKRTTKKRTEYVRVDGVPERFEYEEVDNDLQNRLFYDHLICGWENFFDRHGQPIECTLENKLLLINSSRRFARFVTEALKTLAEADEAKAAQIEKN
jgi:hypothetical protein